MAATLPTEPAPASAAHALIIEDNEHTAYLLRFMLERAGYAVTLAGNGRDAARLLDQDIGVDIELLDLMLPYVDGFELLTQMRERPHWQHVPVIVVSGRTTEADVVCAFELGADDYVRKPFPPHELLARVRRHASSIGCSSAGRALPSGLRRCASGRRADFPKPNGGPRPTSPPRGRRARSSP